MRMCKERLMALLQFWQNKAAWWHRMYMQAAWIDNGKGGAHDCELEAKLANAKVELLEQLIKESK